MTSRVGGLLGAVVAVIVLLGAGVSAPATAAPAASAADNLTQARAYIAALTSRDSSAVRFTKNAVRFEDGLQTGFSGAHLHADLDYGPQYTTIVRIWGLTLRAQPASPTLPARVRAVFYLDAGIAGRALVTTKVDETFRFSTAGAISRIDATIVPVLPAHGR